MSGREQLSIKERDAAHRPFPRSPAGVRRLNADGSITTVVSGLKLAEGGGMAYVATGHERKVLRFDLSTPASPGHELASPRGDAYGLALAPGNTHLYSAHGSLMGIINLSSGALGNYQYLPHGLLGISFAQGMRGYLYVAERGAHKVWRSAIPGPGGLTVPTLVAGDGTQGFGGNGGPATEAQLNEPTDVVVDSTGNLYIAAPGNHRVCRVDGLGLIEAIAGTGDPLPSPAAPTGVTAQILNDRALVQWGARRRQRHRLHSRRQRQPQPALHCGGGRAQRAIDGLASNGLYSFKVLAHNGADVSAASAASAAYRAQAIPTLGEWGVLLLSGLLALIGFRAKLGIAKQVFESPHPTSERW